MENSDDPVQLAPLLATLVSKDQIIRTMHVYHTPMAKRYSPFIYWKPENCDCANSED